MLEDIAILSGGTVISEEKGMKFADANMQDLGQANKVISGCSRNCPGVSRYTTPA